MLFLNWTSIKSSDFLSLLWSGVEMRSESFLEGDLTILNDDVILHLKSSSDSSTVKVCSTDCSRIASCGSYSAFSFCAS